MATTSGWLAFRRVRRPSSAKTQLTWGSSRTRWDLLPETNTCLRKWPGQELKPSLCFCQTSTHTHIHTLCSRHPLCFVSCRHNNLENHRRHFSVFIYQTLDLFFTWDHDETSRWLKECVFLLKLSQSDVVNSRTKPPLTKSSNKPTSTRLCSAAEWSWKRTM